MAVRPAAALVLAHCRGVWNQAAREGGQTAKIGGAIVIGVVAVFLVPISVVLFMIAKATAASLAASTDAGVLAFWAGEQALFSFFFPLFGSFRMKPAFPASRFGRFPVTRFELLLAEIPASLIEVFPILGVGGIIVTNAAFAVAMPRMIPATVVVAAASVCWFIATMFIGSAIVALLVRSRAATIMSICAVFSLAAFAGLQGIRAVVRGMRVVINVWLPALVDALPLTRGYEGVLALRDGAAGEGFALIAWHVGATALLVAIAVPVHSWRVSAELESARWRLAPVRPLRFDTPAAGIGTVYVRQLLGSTIGRAGVIVALFMTGSLSFVAGIVRAVESERGPLPEELARTFQRLEMIPWFAVFPLFLVVAIGSQIWTNQFGFDGGSLRGILSLPVAPQQILLGKTFGLAKYFAIQLGAGLLPVLAFAPPTVGHGIIGAAIAVIGVVVVAGLGQVLSVRFPRSFSGATWGGPLPLYISWIPLATIIFLAVVLAGLYAFGELALRGGGAAFLALAAIGSCFVYRATLPVLGTLMMQHRERLLTM